ncbi:MAG: hypothetical protein AB1791_17715 [Chloroflexota bacterium]
MISLIIPDALKGVDIATRYPTFYRQLLADPELRQTFLETLELYEASHSHHLAPLPTPPVVNLSFLQTASTRLQLAWQLSKEELQNLLFPTGWRLAAGFRSSYGWLDDGYVTLLRSQVSVERLSLDVLLQASLAADAPDEVSLALTVAGQSSADSAAPGSWQATIEWGDYVETVPVNEQGQATFPAIPLPAILQPSSQTVAANLFLSLEPV